MRHGAHIARIPNQLSPCAQRNSNMHLSDAQRAFSPITVRFEESCHRPRLCSCGVFAPMAHPLFIEAFDRHHAPHEGHNPCTHITYGRLAVISAATQVPRPTWPAAAGPPCSMHLLEPSHQDDVNC